MEYQKSNEFNGLDDDNEESCEFRNLKSYKHLEAHEEILKDKIRTKAYRDAILKNKYLFKNKIVLDISCGLGILSIFAVKAGAKHVYAVDSSKTIELATKIIKENSIHNITCIKGKIEEIVLPVNFVDIIISEWMGHMLLFENIIESVIFARNKWLVPGGLIFPNKARIYIAAIEDGKKKDERIEFWHDVYGIDMSVLRKFSLRDPLVEVINDSSIVSTVCPVYEIDVERASMNQIDFVSNYSLQFLRKDFIHGVVGWFEAEFAHCHRPVVISTSPKEKATHWNQTVFYIDRSQPVEVGQIMTGSFAVRRNVKNKKHLDFKISFNINGAYPLHNFQFYQMSS